MQLNLYRYILESEYSLRVSGMYLGIAHPLRTAPLCIQVPRLDAEIALLVEVESEKLIYRSRLVLKCQAWWDLPVSSRTSQV